jgi:DNA-binding NarL/FixJ family response regulator
MENGRTILEFEGTIRIPVLFEIDQKSTTHGIMLTNRERQVLADLLKGKQNKEIAEALHLSVRTVKFHVSAVLNKFAVKSRSQLQCLFIK